MWRILLCAAVAMMLWNCSGMQRGSQVEDEKKVADACVDELADRDGITLSSTKGDFHRRRDTKNPLRRMR